MLYGGRGFRKPRRVGDILSGGLMEPRLSDGVWDIWKTQLSQSAYIGVLKMWSGRIREIEGWAVAQY